MLPHIWKLVFTTTRTCGTWQCTCLQKSSSSASLCLMKSNSSSLVFTIILSKILKQLIKVLNVLDLMVMKKPSRIPRLWRPTWEWRDTSSHWEINWSSRPSSNKLQKMKSRTNFNPRPIKVLKLSGWDITQLIWIKLPTRNMRALSYQLIQLREKNILANLLSNSCTRDNFMSSNRFLVAFSKPQENSMLMLTMIILH